MCRCSIFFSQSTACFCVCCFGTCAKKLRCSDVLTTSTSPLPSPPPSPPPSDRFSMEPRQCVFMTGISHGVDDFLPGVRCLVKSLRGLGSRIPLVVATTSDYAGSVRDGLADISRQANVAVITWDHFPVTPRLPAEKLPRTLRSLIARWKGSHEYDKLNVFGASQFRRVVWLDADIFLLRNIDELCDESAMLPAKLGLAAALNAGYEPRTCWRANGTSIVAAGQCQNCRHHGVQSDELPRSRYMVWALHEQAAGKRDGLSPCQYEFNSGACRARASIYGDISRSHSSHWVRVRGAERV